MFFNVLLIISWVSRLVAESYTHQNPIYEKHLGQCITIKAKTYFHYPKQFEDITWKKDSKPLISSERIKITGRSLSITSLRRTDHAYYEVIVKNTNNSISETTDSWLNIQDCGKHEKEEIPSSIHECEDLCTEKCSADWTYVVGSESKCLQYFKERLTWSGASEKCQAIGGELVSIDSLQENSFAGDLLQSANGGWTGLNDRNNENKYIWSFNSRDTPSFYTWGKGEPSNYNSGCNIENCILMKPSNGRWIDYVCSSFKPFVCQVNLLKNGSNPYTDDSWKCGASKCYKSFNDKLTWVDALNRCQQFGGKLAEVYSTGENDIMQNLISEDSWIGLNDIWEAGKYRWNFYQGEDRNSIQFFNWNNGEPNDKFYQPLSPECSGEDCIQMRKFNGTVTWHDLSCDTKIPYLCEKIRDRAFSTGAYVGMVIGCLIFVATTIGVIQAAYEKHKRTAVKDIIKAAYQQDISMRDSNIQSDDDMPNLITHAKYE